MYKNILNIYKPLGVTPLEAIEGLKKQNSHYKNKKMTYAGRLDPMAEGVLLVLAGEAVQQKDKYLRLDKEYEAEIIFGFETDTYDLLGLAEKKENIELTKEQIGQILKKFIGSVTLPFPPFSSYKIKGKPMHWWARAGKLDEIEIPKQNAEIYDIKLLDFYEINKNDLQKIFEDRINLVKGDFRQAEIKKRWHKILRQCGQKTYQVAKIRIYCSSGIYIRSIAHQLGKNLNTGAILFYLLRTKVGTFNIKDSINIINL